MMFHLLKAIVASSKGGCCSFKNNYGLVGRDVISLCVTWCMSYKELVGLILWVGGFICL